MLAEAFVQQTTAGAVGGEGGRGAVPVVDSKRTGKHMQWEFENLFTWKSSLPPHTTCAHTTHMSIHTTHHTTHLSTHTTHHTAHMLVAELQQSKF